MKNYKKYLEIGIISLLLVAFISFGFLPFLSVQYSAEALKYTEEISLYSLFAPQLVQRIGLAREEIAIIWYSFILGAVVIAIVYTILKSFKIEFNILPASSLVLSLFGFILMFFTIQNNAGIENTKIRFSWFCIFEFITVILILAYALRLCFEHVRYSINEIVEISLLIALSIVLDKFASIKIGATGGSLNISGVALILIALRHGPIKGLLASSFVFGLLTCILDGYGLHTLPFDYMIGFSGYAVAGLGKYITKLIFKNKEVKEDTVEYTNLAISFTIGCIAIFITRMIGSSISSMRFYDLDLIGALEYNVMYIGPSAALCLGVCLALIYPIKTINKMYPVKNR